MSEDEYRDCSAVDAKLLLAIAEVSIKLRRKLIPGCNCDIGYTCDICAKKILGEHNERKRK